MLSLYRRHRPRTFDAVVGQEHIVKTLRNAIELDKVHHAYLFVGSRGTGKTSMAKLLACALNAEGGARVEFDPESPAAKAILNGMSLDVVEMDAASNNSVDDIRELRENVALAPMQGGKRVYILDEAHMLTTAAWNAFLKTLEEPPQHVVFVLATTEAHKVPATIIDRCHRFDFQRPSLEQIAGVLKRVAGEEGIEIPDPAVGMLARAATGSFRDALGTLEQLVTYGGNDVKLDDVLEILGVADAELVLAAGEALADRDPRGGAPDGAVAVRVRAATSRSSCATSPRTFATCSSCRRSGHVPDSFSVTAEHTDRLSAQADRLSQGEILRAIDFLASAIAAVKDGSEPRIQLEMALLKATQPQADLSLQALMFRIDQLEAALGVTRARAAAREAPAPDPPEGTAAAAVRRTPGGVLAAAGRRGGARSDRHAVARRRGGGRRGERDAVRRPVRRHADRARGRPPHRRLPGRRRVRQEEGGAGPRSRRERGARHHGAVARARLRAERRGPVAGPATLDHDQLIERLRAEFAAEEVFEEPDEEKD